MLIENRNEFQEEETLHKIRTKASFIRISLADVIKVCKVLENEKAVGFGNIDIKWNKKIVSAPDKLISEMYEQNENPKQIRTELKILNRWLIISQLLPMVFNSEVVPAKTIYLHNQSNVDQITNIP